jgi:hypothetical protein
MIDLRSRWLAAVAVRVWSLKPNLDGIPPFSDVAARPELMDHL